ncbi:surfeit locus protein 2 isoform X2 [Aplysia californica]|uniref:Surfeit locus protein 2 isoform X2 n=1 Tax=Aplysia californica TaxID=6500 RepID=A0ABM0K1E3_APLCA|nr:surfeit locus protein 2 isoform X2 [Aplysia californica]
MSVLIVIRCRFTNHEMPATVSALESYVKGKKFRKASEHRAYNYQQYQPHLMPSTKKKHLHELFCKLTLRHIGRAPQDVERHVKGKKFKKALARWETCQKTGEKFVPRAGGRQPTGGTSDSDSVGGGDNYWDDDNSDNDDNDDMSDLYPDEIFKQGKAGDANSDDDDDDDDIDDSPGTDEDNGQNDDATPPKRPKQNTSKQKKTKKEKLKNVVEENEEGEEDSDYDMDVLNSGKRNSDSEEVGVSSASTSVPSSTHKSEKAKSNKRQHPKKPSNVGIVPGAKKKKVSL